MKSIFTADRGHLPDSSADMTAANGSRGRVAIASICGLWLLIYAVSLAAVPEQVAAILKQQQVSGVLGMLVLTGLCLSVAIVELLRRRAHLRRTWTRAGHMAAVVLSWPVSSALVVAYWSARCGMLG